MLGLEFHEKLIPDRLTETEDEQGNQTGLCLEHDKPRVTMKKPKKIWSEID